MDRQTISVCLIVKNEEKNLLRCLKSIENIADEIIVVDTGSTDNTIELARSLNAKVIEYNWNNDFSEARNKSLEYATKDWILFLDADEEIPKEEGEKFKLIINEPKNSKFEGYYFRLVNIISENDVGDAVVFRAFRNDMDYRFKGKMHEQVIASVQDKKGNDVIGSTDIRILHYGYDPLLTSQEKKCDRNIKLLLSFDEEDKDGYYYYSLGNEYTRIGNFEGALETYNKSLSLTKIVNRVTPIYYPYLMVSIMNLLHYNKRFKQELDYIEGFKKDCKDFKDIHFNEALIYIEMNNFSKAKKALLKYLSCSQNVSSYTYPSNSFEKYNIPNIMEQLEVASIDHDENLISSVIIYQKESPRIIETLKSLNEVSREVIVAIPSNNTIDTTELINLGATIIKTSSINEGEMFFEALRKCHGKYNLKIRLGEIFSSDSQGKIIKLLSNSKNDILKVNIINIQGDQLGEEVRIFKNSKRFKKYEDFKKYFEVKKIKDSLISIHKVYEEDISIMDNINGDEYKNKRVLIGSILSLSEDNSMKFLKSLKDLNIDGLIVDYYFINNNSTCEMKKMINSFDISSKDSIVKNTDYIRSDYESLMESDEAICKNEIIDYAREEQYDYLLLVDSKLRLNKEIIFMLIGNKKEIVANKEFSEGSNNNIIMISRESIINGVNFSRIKSIDNKNENLDFVVRAEILGFDIYINQNYI